MGISLYESLEKVVITQAIKRALFVIYLKNRQPLPI
jgi:hypothetical protein